MYLDIKTLRRAYLLQLTQDTEGEIVVTTPPACSSPGIKLSWVVVVAILDWIIDEGKVICITSHDSARPAQGCGEGIWASYTTASHR